MWDKEVDGRMEEADPPAHLLPSTWVLKAKVMDGTMGGSRQSAPPAPAEVLTWPLMEK